METVVESHYREGLKRAGHLAQAADHHGALAAYDEAIRLAPCRADAHYEMGLLHHKLGQLAEAVACFERAAELAPEDATVWNNLGVLRFSQGALEKAAACLERAIEIDPKYVDSLLNAAKVLAKLGRIEQAEHRLRRCLQIQPGSQGAMRLLQDLGIEIDRPMTWSPRPTATAELSRLPGRERIRIRVLTHAELEKDLAKCKQWADFWVKQELERELESLGLAVVEQDPDVILYLFGVPVRGLPKNTYNMVWVYSHPDMVTPGNLRGFHRIFSLSSSYARKLRSMGYGDVEVMIGATSKKPLEREKQHAVVFVGNSRGLHGRKIVTDLGDAPHNLKVWGRGWDQLLPERFYGGSYYDYEKLSELYASALVSLNDHHPDMAREGFVSVRIFDILASGGFAISDRNAGIEEIFGDAVPQYESPKHLRELLDFYLTHPEERLKLAKEGREIALSHTWRKRAEQFARAALQGMEGQRATVGASLKEGPRPYVEEEGRAYSCCSSGGAYDMKVLCVDTISIAAWVDNTGGMMKAYRKVATLKPFAYRRLAAKYGVARMNEMLVETALEFHPDLIHLGKCEQIKGATIKAIKEQIDTYVVHFYGDFRWSPRPWVVDIGRYADCTLFNNDDARYRSMYEAAGVKHICGWWSMGTDPEVFYPRKVQRTWDLVFMGSNIRLPEYKGYATRRHLLEASLDAGFCLHVFGNIGGWRYLEGRGDIHLHPFTVGGGFAEACSRAKITLGTSAVHNVHMYASWQRTFNSMASGAFHLTHYLPGLETFFENKKHLVWFNSVPEAIDLIKYYLAHEKEREEIATAGRQEVLAHHTWDARIGEMLTRWREAKA